MLVRTDTPDAWLTCGLERARRTTSSTISDMKRGISTFTPLAEPSAVRARSQAFCSAMRDPLVDRLGIVRANDRADAVLQRRDDPAAVGVILGVGAEDQADVQVQANRIAANLHVALFEHVEQADLNARGQVRQFVDGEDARDCCAGSGRSASSIHPTGIAPRHASPGRSRRSGRRSSRPAWRAFRGSDRSDAPIRSSRRRPARRRARLPVLVIGRIGSSLISTPARTGIHSSSSSGSMRRMRVLACPRRPRNSRSCLERMPLMICGMTLSR